MTPAELRLACRQGRMTGTTSGEAAGFVQANLVVLPMSEASQFLMFCQRNPQPCPLLEVTSPGAIAPRRLSPDADLRTDLPRYRVWKNGVLADEPFNVLSEWRDDLVSFLIGCSFTFESALLAAGIPLRHVAERRNVSMYRTNIPCKPAGKYRGDMVVSMRPLLPEQVEQATAITSALPRSHGGPIHVGDPAAIGIADLSQPEFGDPVTIQEDEVPVFWACGVTPQLAVMNAAPEIAITHSPGCMLVTDVRDADLK